MRIEEEVTENLLFDIILVLSSYGIKELNLRALAELIGAEQSVLDSLGNDVVTIDPDDIELAMQQKYLH